ncbi:sensor histidine kinase [Actinorugispora endophytica]|uniref:histidine kinase n=1 Tax=Actinorugispora endophytica TaxID=1605990 RepID=A0A4R6UHH9_9ACTN|nr:histidine kinase [Actinorugispora endophytica]TDQ45486.1 signal transduction histidine kinase [Actinorugispora endophytica]
MINRRRVLESWRRFGATVWYLPFGLLLFAGSFLPALHSQGTQLGGLPPRPFDVLAVVAIALECLPLAVRKRWPVVCLALVSLGFAVDQLRGYHSLAGVALPIALVSVGSLLERYRRTTALLFSMAYVPLAVALFWLGSEESPGGPPGETPSGFVTFYLALAFAWGIGTWLRSTRAAEAERRRRVAEDTRAAERARIARELHDVVTHHVTAMVVQAEAARYLTAVPDRLDQTLTAVTDTGRRAITDLRHLLDLLNPDHGTGARTPPVGRLVTLVEQTRQAGQPVEFTEEGAPAESSGSAYLVAHRVVQEALTNALKHAHGSRTSVRVRHSEREITVEVDTDGSGSKGGAPGGSGRGLAGLRERVDVLGGDFSADRQPGGGFAVRARIPAGGLS